MGYGPIQTTPQTQTSTAAYEAMLGTVLDRRNTVRGEWSYQITETGGLHAFTVKMQGSLNALDWFDLSVMVDPMNNTQYNAPQNIAAGATFTLGGAIIAFPQWPCFVRVLIIDTVAGSHGTALVQGFAG